MWTADPILEWIARPNADSYDIYFGQVNPPPYISNQVETPLLRANWKGKNLLLEDRWKKCSRNCGGSPLELHSKAGDYTRNKSPTGNSMRQREQSHPMKETSLDGDTDNMSPSSWTNGHPGWSFEL